MNDRIESSARKSYIFQTYLTGDDIKIESKDGVFSLTGMIVAEFHKPLAQETVANLPGVKSVDNRQEVKGAPPTANSDAWLVESENYAPVSSERQDRKIEVYVQGRHRDPARECSQPGKKGYDD